MGKPLTDMLQGDWTVVTLQRHSAPDLTSSLRTHCHSHAICSEIPVASRLSHAQRRPFRARASVSLFTDAQR